MNDATPNPQGTDNKPCPRCGHATVMRLNGHCDKIFCKCTGHAQPKDTKPEQVCPNCGHVNSRPKSLCENCQVYLVLPAGELTQPKGSDTITPEEDEHIKWFNLGARSERSKQGSDKPELKVSSILIGDTETGIQMGFTDGSFAHWPMTEECYRERQEQEEGFAAALTSTEPTNWGKHIDRGPGFTHHAGDDCDPANTEPTPSGDIDAIMDMIDDVKDPGMVTGWTTDFDGMRKAIQALITKAYNAGRREGGIAASDRIYIWLGAKGDSMPAELRTSLQDLAAQLKEEDSE